MIKNDEKKINKTSQSSKDKDRIEEGNKEGNEDEEENTQKGLDFSEFFDFNHWNKIKKNLREKYRDEVLNFKPKYYDKEQIRRFLKHPWRHERQLREVSQYFTIVSKKYDALIEHFANMLTLDHIIVPINPDVEIMETKKFKEMFNKIADYVEKYNIKHEFKKILRILLRDGVFYGYKRDEGRKSFMIQRFPTNHCMVTSMDSGVYNFAMDMRYFDSRSDELDNFPRSVQRLYEEYLNDREPWKQIDPEKSVCFRFYEDHEYDLPPFTGIFEDLLDYEETKSAVKRKIILEAFKLVSQKIPFKKEPEGEKDFLIKLESAKYFHDMIDARLPEGIEIVTTPMDIEEIDLEREKSGAQAEMDFMRDNYYDEASVSKSIFNSDSQNQVSINRSINVNEGVMFKLLRQFERFLKRDLHNYIQNEKYAFKVILPDITIYNREKMFDQYLKSAQFGMPKSLVAAVLGFSVKDLMALSNLEDGYLDILNKLKPLRSSHIGDDQKEGRPESDEGDLSPEGERRRATGKDEEE